MVPYPGIAPGLGAQQKEQREETTAQGREKALDRQDKPAFIITNT